MSMSIWKVTTWRGIETATMSPKPTVAVTVIEKQRRGLVQRLAVGTDRCC